MTGRVTLEWPDFAIDTLEAYYCLEGGASVQARLAKRGFTTSQYSIRHKASRLDLSSDMLEFTPIYDVARDAGVTRRAVELWLEAHDYARFCRYFGPALLLPLPAVRLYLPARRAPRRPAGWLGIEQAAERLQIHPSRVRRLCAALLLPSVTVRGVTYVDPYALPPALPTSPPPGYVRLMTLAAAAGLDRKALTDLPSVSVKTGAGRPAYYTSSSNARAFLSARGHRQEQVETLLRKALEVQASGVKGEG